MRLIRQLWFQVLVSMCAGAVLGILKPSFAVELKPLGDAFVSLIRMIIPPVIFCTVVHGIAGMTDMRRVGRVAIKALIYFEAVTIIALFIALLVVDWWRPGTGISAAGANFKSAAITTYAGEAKAQGVVSYLLHIIPDTFTSAFVHGDVLQVLFVSVLFGFALSALGDKGRAVFNIVGSVAAIFFRVVGFIMWAAPLGAFGALAFTVGSFGTSILLSLGELIVEFYLVCLLFVFVVLGAIAWWCRVNIVRLIIYIREELLLVAATTSSEVVLPRLIEKLENLGCEESTVGLVIPAGYSFNLDGTCLYLATASMFLAQATNTHLSLSQQLGLLAVLTLTSKGAAGVAGAAFVVLAATLSSTGTIPVSSIGLVLGIHRLMAEGLTFVNVVGNSVATIAIARWEGAVKLETLQQKVGFLGR